MPARTQSGLILSAEADLSLSHVLSRSHCIVSKTIEVAVPLVKFIRLPYLFGSRSSGFFPRKRLIIGLFWRLSRRGKQR